MKEYENIEVKLDNLVSKIDELTELLKEDMKVERMGATWEAIEPQRARVSAC